MVVQYLSRGGGSHINQLDTVLSRSMFSLVIDNPVFKLLVLVRSFADERFCPFGKQFMLARQDVLVVWLVLETC